MDQTATQPAIAAPPPVFCEGNRPFWLLVRRFMIAFLHELDKAYGWETFGEK